MNLLIDIKTRLELNDLINKSGYSITLSEVHKLKTFYIYEIGLCSLPDSIYKFVNLEELFLHDNKLTSLPKTIKYLTKLKYLDISDNNISNKEQLKIKKLLPNCRIIF